MFLDSLELLDLYLPNFRFGVDRSNAIRRTVLLP